MIILTKSHQCKLVLGSAWEPAPELYSKLIHLDHNNNTLEVMYTAEVCVWVGERCVRLLQQNRTPGQTPHHLLHPTMLHSFNPGKRREIIKATTQPLGTRNLSSIVCLLLFYTIATVFQIYDVWDEKEKARPYTFTDSRVFLTSHTI